MLSIEKLSHPLHFLLLGCKYIVHSQCANKNPEPCASTFVKSKQEIGVRNTMIAFNFPLVYVYFCFLDMRLHLQQRLHFMQNPIFSAFMGI